MADVQVEVEILSKYVKDKLDWRSENGKANYEIIGQTKHNYNDETENCMFYKVLSDSLARVSTPLHHDGPRCMAINLNLTKTDANKYKLNKINFASKFKTDQQKIELRRILNFCFNDKEYFFNEKMRKDICDKMSLILNDRLSPNNYLNNNLNYLSNMTDATFFDFLVELFDDKNILNDDIILMTNIKKKYLKYILLIYSDRLILKEFFNSLIENKNELDNILIPFDCSNKPRLKKRKKELISETHPDSILAIGLHTGTENLQNRYIGTTYLCCIYCSLFLDCYQFEFSGTSAEFDTTWRIPPNTQTISGNCYENFLKSIG